ncbi:hypothetical protein [Pseudomarimonas salicorniae]|uniref:Uncharacterized protein n=1 Tax=Pseudomarimonas salicorniae TaxID=2933270 RepID=A0ABT0GDC4_9GAMM|nr:hypothetical protein [Lysobacter sp. CAU 1642]MCK7592184.1 hypothetical protein [Lysobacter sp. CAU 1642]
MSAATLLALLALAAGMLAIWSWPPAAAPAAPARGRGLRVLRRGMASMLMAVALLAILLAAAVHHYRPWRAGSLIAELAVREIGPQHFEVTLSLPAEVPTTYALRGDQWQFDVRLLRWKLPAALLGAPRLYQPDRLSGRYSDIEAERSAERSVHALADDSAWDAWRLKRRFASQLPIFAADYGSSAYLPLVDGTRFHILVGDVGGIEARPADPESARRLAEQDW